MVQFKGMLNISLRFILLGKNVTVEKKGKKCAWFVSQWLFCEKQSLELPGSRVKLSMATKVWGQCPDIMIAKSEEML